MSDLRLVPLRPDQRDAGVAFYESQSYHGGIAVEDFALGAWDGGRIVGLVRLAEEHDVNLLRGMFIDASYQRQGLGTRMLEALTPEMELTTHWLICPDRLNDFYARVGFQPAPVDERPPHLVVRAAKYQQVARGTMNVLRRPPANS